MSEYDLIVRGGTVVTAADTIRADIGIAGGRIAAIADRLDGPRTLDAGGLLVLPGGVDTHCHIEQLQPGGGADEEDFVTGSTACLAGGTTTVEAKTGYHLDGPGEIEAVRILAALAGEAALPSIEVTWLAGHGVGPEFSGDPDGYIDDACRWCERAREAGARHADVFCDEGYFTVAQSRRLLTAAAEAGLLPRIHADELARTGGARLAAELGCSSADHLLLIEELDARALAASGVVATLAPVTALAMGRTPPVDALLAAGVSIALGSDHNPGTCGTTSMSLVVALAVAELGLSVGQALEAATAGGAASLRLTDRGRVEVGRRADLVAWNADHEGAIAWSYGLRPRQVWKA